MQYMAARDVAEMERIRGRVDELVDDPATAESLKPWYLRFCKRPAFSDEYLQTFNRTNVTLIDTDGKGLDRLTETGIVFDGQEYPVDSIVYATGFEFGVAATRSGGFEVHGPSGMTLSEHRAQGVRSLHGMYHSGFPNLFTIGGLHQAGLSINIPLVFGGQARHAAQLIRTFLDRGVDAVDVRPDAEQRWADVIATKSQYVPEVMSICTPGAFTNENPLDGGEPSVFATAYGGGPVEYLDVLERWRSGPIEDDLQLSTRERS
jgi:cyclohexanone monooxygenase